MIRAIVSDLGKVIIDYDNRLFLARLAAASGHSVEDLVRLAFRGSGLLNDFDRGALTPDEFQAQVCDRVGVSLGPEEFFRMYNDVFRLIPGTLDVLKSVKEQARLVLLSNTDPMRYAFILKTFPTVRIFDAAVISFEVKLLKPDPRIYELAIERAGVPASECVFIDDLPANVGAGARLGMKGIVFEEGATDLAAELRRLGLPV